MDIRKLQRAIVDGLEDVKGQNIVVFNTEHLSALFERVVIASGTSNRQTKALAASVRDAVKSSGFPILRTEGEGNGEWIIVDCGAAVVHLMQPSIRQYYHLEEIWGDKPVRLKLDASPVRLVKAAAAGDEPPSSSPPRKSAAYETTAAAAGRKAAAAPRRPPARPATDDDAMPAKAAARKLPASGGSAPKPPPAPRGTAGLAGASGVTRTIGVKSPPKRASGVATQAPAKTVPTKRAVAKKPAATTAAGKTAAPAAPSRRAAAVRKPAARKPADVA